MLQTFFCPLRDIGLPEYVSETNYGINNKHAEIIDLPGQIDIDL